MPGNDANLAWDGPAKKLKNGKSNRSGESKRKVSKTVQEKEKRGKKKCEKPKGKPNRPLSGYNLFFRRQRETMLGDDMPSVMMQSLRKRVHCKTHGKIGFAEMAREIGRRWKALELENKKEFEDMAKVEIQRYGVEVAKWKESQRAERKRSSLDILSEAAATVSDNESVHSCGKSVSSEESHTTSNVSILKERREQPAEQEKKQALSPRVQSLGPSPMPNLVMTHYSPKPSYYERIAAGAVIPPTSRFPMLYQDKFFLQQMILNQAPARRRSLVAGTSLERAHPVTASELAFLAQLELQRQQMLASLSQR